jgi:hypothetical protein
MQAPQPINDSAVTMNGDFDFFFRKALELAGDFHPVD